MTLTLKRYQHKKFVFQHFTHEFFPPLLPAVTPELMFSPGNFST